MKIASVAGDFSVSVAKKLGLDKVLADLNRKFDGIGNATNRTLDEIVPGGKIPSVRNGEFNKWFDDLTPDEFDKVWSEPALRTKIEDRIRHPKGQHEWCMVCRADDFKRWDVSMDEIQRFRTKTSDLKWTDPDTGSAGGHGRTGSTKFHNELKDIIDSSSSLDDFNLGVQQLRDRWKIDPSLLPDLPKSGG
jgi:filamentous hemagglutinin